MNADIDEKLSTACPPGRGPDPALDHALRTVIAASELAASGGRHHRRRLRTRVVIGAVAAGLVLGTASTAAATQPWLWNKELAHPDTASTITLPSGNTCEIRAIVEQTFPASPNTGPTIAAARTYAKTIDLRTFDLSRIRASMLKAQRISPSSSLDDQYFFAVSAELSDRIFAYMAKHGYDADNISVSSESHCARQR